MACATVWEKTVTQTKTVYASTVTGVPAGCREAIALTRKISQRDSPRQIAADTERFKTAAAGCRIPPACAEALIYLPKILVEQHRTELLALGKRFEAAAAGCR